MPTASADDSTATAWRRRRRTRARARHVCRAPRTAARRAADDADAAWLGRELDHAVKARATIVVAVRMPDGTEREFTIEATGLGGGRLRGLDRAVDVERTCRYPASAASAPSDRRAHARLATRAPAAARSVDWDAMADGPLIVQSDRTVLLEVAHPDAETRATSSRSSPSSSAHPSTSTPTGSPGWGSGTRAAGHSADDMLATLDRWSRFPCPHRCRSTSVRP
jgi:hypothetical protein